MLDIGTGTGVLPRNLYRFGAHFTAADISENQIKYAKELSKGMDIQYIVSSAEDLEMPAKSFDVVTACQCFMYFDTGRLFKKISELLKNGGHFLFPHMDCLTNEDAIAAKTEELILQYNPLWSGS